MTGESSNAYIYDYRIECGIVWQYFDPGCKVARMPVALGQENLVHGHQQAAAAKPLNQGIRQLAPKTPGNKYPKTPLKLPLNDENDIGGIGGGKFGQRTNGKSNGNMTAGGKKMVLADKNAFVTPVGKVSIFPFSRISTDEFARPSESRAPRL